MDLFLEIFGERERKVGLRNRTERIFFLSFFLFLSFRWGKTGGVGSQKIEEIPCISSPKITLFYCFLQGQIFFLLRKKGEFV